MSLKDWQRNGWLVEHKPSREEMQALLGVIDRSLQDAGAKGLSPDGRFGFAYNAALQCAMAALAAEGYRPARQAHHYRAIESLELTLGESRDRIRVLDAARKKRNVAAYERAGAVSDSEVGELVALARELRTTLLGWLEERHPEIRP